ncbi:hypothetical protein GDO78_019501 [Eleutherodactylus coqui]|uniref:Uncharacterized protein n=1 Tax=Eleutherodactylus coqui TaxID=57060 RepID=A0A8J6EQI5_ELECQ|nr:hypothetical protein GDO78_019501 [Eleutherodactylus coqui]
MRKNRGAQRNRSSFSGRNLEILADVPEPLLIESLLISLPSSFRSFRSSLQNRQCYPNGVRLACTLQERNVHSMGVMVGGNGLRSPQH